ncbi:MAG: copper resistance protein NlpE N-terminal domain-containing protein [Cyclonatronaceae bacterium]
MIMRINMILAVFALIAAGLAACSSGNGDADRNMNTNGERVTVPQTDGQGVHNAANSLDWHGTYTGVLPCADCEGISTTLTLNADETYHLISVYLGREDGEFHSRGTFSWNEAGNTVRLIDIDSGSGLYLVTENRLFYLDTDGNRITGDLAGRYILQKEHADAGIPLKGTRWELDEIMGQPVVQRGEDESTPWFILSSEENRIHGFGGCNNFSGSFALQEGGRITFSQMGATKMACPDLEVDYESMVFGVFEQTDNYIQRGNMLLLNRAEMAPLAVWRAESYQ